MGFSLHIAAVPPRESPRERLREKTNAMNIVISALGNNRTDALPGIAWSFYVSAINSGSAVATLLLSQAMRFSSYEQADAACKELERAHPMLGFTASSTAPYDYDFCR